jgi:hypothetical protein
MKGLNMTTTEVECVPFDSMGKITAPAPEIVAKLPAEKKARLMAILKANIEANEAEDGMRETEKNLFAAVANAQRAKAEFDRLTPRPTHASELRRVIAARAGRPLPPAKVDPNAEAAAIAADEAEALSVKLRGDLEVAKLVLKNKRGTLAEKIMAWQGLQPKRDTAWLVRENSKRETERKLARIAKGLPPDDVPDEPVRVEAIDQIYSRHDGSVNINWRRPRGSWRGAPAPKVPSEG